MKWFNNIIQRIDNYFSANENKIIKELRKKIINDDEIIKYREKSIKALTNTLKKQDALLVSAYNQLNDLTFISFNRLFKEKKTKYTWKPRKRIYLHESLQDFSNDTVYQELYLAFLKTLGLKDSYKNIDTAVYKIVLMVQKYINNTLKDDYKSDKEVFGVNEYWLSPREAFDQYVIEIMAGDCEDTSALLYGAIITGLKYLGYNYTNRLLRIDINFPVHHAVVSYQKSNSTWACIESTYGESRFSKNWIRDKDMFKGVYTGLWHIFNEKTEYELIHSYQRK